MKRASIGTLTCSLVTTGRVTMPYPASIIGAAMSHYGPWRVLLVPKQVSR
jgi:hypothetical protein